MLAARETKMLSAERMERMIDAPTNDEAAKILEECGYADLSGLSAKEAGAALEAHIAALFDEVEGMVPEAQLVQLFRLKYDYHKRARRSRKTRSSRRGRWAWSAMRSCRSAAPWRRRNCSRRFSRRTTATSRPFWRRPWSAPPRSWRARPIRRQRTSSSTARISRRCSRFPTA